MHTIIQTVTKRHALKLTHACIHSDTHARTHTHTHTHTHTCPVLLHSYRYTVMLDGTCQETCCPYGSDPRLLARICVLPTHTHTHTPYTNIHTQTTDTHNNYTANKHTGLTLSPLSLSLDGKNDGSVKGKRYFHCKSSHGLFVKPEKATHRGINCAKILPDSSLENST